MVDLYLMALLHGENVNRKKNAVAGGADKGTDTEYEACLEKLAEEYASEETEAYLVNNKLLSKEDAKQHLKLEFKAAVRLEEQQSLLSFAIRCILQDGKLYLNEEEWERLSNEIKQTSEKLSKISYKDELPERLYPFLGITDQGMQLIDRISREKYKEENYSLAQALSALLTVLDPLNPSYWLHFGICYQEGGFYEKAIKAYSICHLIDPSAILAWLFCSECYLRVNNHGDAKIEFDEAKRIAATLENQSDWDDQLVYLERCLKPV